ncbi:NADH:flavin oxidoreductase/NADH oxidase [Specibacter cremeus]|uniref:NADH:flavin oxidoreductase/NADH oxidase n=1 Tax=Specibacter cremeus TaxID=1629051 RepID=UPI000F7802D4|nr:NADH:flavin oxidoreductase/NADH oxidase [Specibacter cremeus]
MRDQHRAPALFAPLRLRDLVLAHRGWVPAMCQYSCDPVDAPGVPHDWHLVHLGQFAVGGAALILTEATAVNAAGRISPRDTGLWNDEQATAWARIVDFVHRSSAVGTKIGVQLAHAGRKASTYWPFAAQRGSVPATEHGWQALGPTGEPFGSYAAPRALTDEDIRAVIADFAAAAARAVRAGFDTVEIHGAHGYLLHQFASPLVNTRTDAWGGDEERRFALTLAVVDAVRSAVPGDMPVLLRVSATDWVEGGLDAAAAVRLARAAAARGVDLVDVSTGGAVPAAAIPVEPGYQVPFARAIRERAGVPTAAVGLIDDAAQADRVIRDGAADAVLVGRGALRDPHWWQRAAHELGTELPWAPQYERAAWWR